MPKYHRNGRLLLISTFKFDNVKMTFAIRTYADSVSTCADSVSTGTYSERQRIKTEAAKFEFSQ